MKEGFYFNPTNNSGNKLAKIAVVMGTYAPFKQVESVPGRRRNSAKNNQEWIEFNENKLSLIKFTLACHKYFNSKVDYDLIIVDNSSKDIETVKFLESYTKENNVTFFSRENTGFSFGSHKFAWDTFGDKYDYYLFLEQDGVPSQDGWLLMFLEKFLSDRNIGAVGNMVEGYRDRDTMLQYGYFKKEYLGKYFDVDKFNHCNLDGVCSFTSSSIIKECGLNLTYDNTGEVNELLWMHNVLDKGYKIVGFATDEYRYTHGVGYLDFDNESEKLAPIIHGQVLYGIQEMREYFSWYEGLKDFEFINK